MDSMRLRINVTRSDIDKCSYFFGANDCPIAQSLLRRGYKRPYVGITTIAITKDGVRFYAKTPEKIAEYINYIDFNSMDKSNIPEKTFYLDFK